MKKIIAFAGTNHTASINQQLLAYITSKIKEANVETIKLTDFDIPLYNQDIEETTGIPDEVKKLNAKIEQADHLIIALPEHNGNFSTFFKNIMDWLSRDSRDFFGGKTILLAGSSPGPGGAANVLAVAEKSFPFFQGKIATTFSLPYFQNNFAEGKITSAEYEEKLNQAIQQFTTQINQVDAVV